MNSLVFLNSKKNATVRAVYKNSLLHTNIDADVAGSNVSGAIVLGYDLRLSDVHHIYMYMHVGLYLHCKHILYINECTYCWSIHSRSPLTIEGNVKKRIACIRSSEPKTEVHKLVCVKTFARGTSKFETSTKYQITVESTFCSEGFLF